LERPWKFDGNKRNFSHVKGLYNALGHTPALAGGARELRFPQGKKAQFVTVMGIIDFYMSSCLFVSLHTSPKVTHE
jgi:hypothetical protein